MLMVVRHADAGDKRPLHWPEGSTWMLQRSDNGRRHVGGRLLAPLELDGHVPTG
jgi:hypothetical protein